MPSASLGVFMVFLQGVLSFFSPCVLPLIPVYLTVLTGRSLDELQRTPTRATVLHALWFVLGIGVVFIALGATASALGRFLQRNLTTIQIVCGVLVIVMGLFELGALRIHFFLREKRHEVHRKPAYLTSFLTGIAFSFGWTPCIGPVLTSILVLAARAATLWQGVGYLIIYSLGMGLPFLCIALFIGPLAKKLPRLNRYTPLLQKLSGVLLIVLGILLCTGKLGLLMFGLS